MRAGAAAMREDFLGPERGNGVVGWAARQLVLWAVLIAGAFWIADTQGWLRPQQPGAPKPLASNAAEASPDAAPAQTPVLGRPAPIVTNTLTLRAQRDGYVYVDADVNGSPMRMAFDTGAAIVSLTQKDALRAGVAGNLNFSIPFGTANGRTLGAPVVLREIRVGQLVIRDVDAVVMQNLGTSLLGQSFLKRLESYQMKDGILTLAWQ
jgi:aspartyl protease family protein